MNTIQIETKGTDLETIVITLDDNQVASIYEQHKELQKEVAELKKKLTSTESSLKYANESKTELQQELNEANTLLTALNVKETNDAEESWNRSKLKVTTRIALYIATNK
jgi:septal ring factor EnvC (AmiA/AmiB activator)